MAHFRGTVQGARGEASRLGTVKSDMVVQAQSWEGKAVAHLYQHSDGRDWVRITLETHHGHGTYRELYDGPVGGMPEVTP